MADNDEEVIAGQLSKIKLPSGSLYEIKDAKARVDISDLSSLIENLQKYTEYLGVTETELVDGVTTSPDVVISGETVTATKGDIVTYGSKEFIYNGTVWQEFGDLSGLGALAHADSVTATYTPEGSVTINLTTANEITSTGEFTPEGNVELTLTSTTLTADYTPAGNITFTTDTVDITGKFKPAGTIAVSGEGTTNYTPGGSISATFSNGSMTDGTITGGTITAKYTELTGVNYNEVTGVSYLTKSATATVNTAGSSWAPAGSVDVTLTSTAGETTSINSAPATVITSFNAGSYSTLTANISGETLEYSLVEGTLPTAGSITTTPTTVLTSNPTVGVSSATFTGESVDINVNVPDTFTVDTQHTGATILTAESNVSSGAITGGTVTGTVTGTVGATFTGTGVNLVFSGENSDITVQSDQIPTAATFTGTSANIETNAFNLPTSATFTGTEGNVEVSGTPTGTIDATFNGTSAVLSGYPVQQ